MFSLDKLNKRDILVIIIVLINMYLLGLEIKIMKGVFGFSDFVGQWRLTAYACRGIDPYPLIGLDHAIIESIGIIPKGWGTSPWGLLLGNIFYPGYMTLENAMYYFVVINIVLICITALCVARKIKHISIQLSTYSFFCAFFSFWFFFSFNQGNAGGCICCLLVLVCLYYDTHPFFSGVLLGLTMIKPQISLIVCLAFLFLRNYRVVIVSFTVVCLSMLVVSGLVHNNPINILNEFLNAGIGNNQNYSGIFTLFFIEKPLLAMSLSIMTGIVFVCILNYLIPKNLWKPFCLFPACLAATFWCYSFYNDFYILLLPLVVSLYSILYVDNKILLFISFFGALYLSVGSFIVFYDPINIYKLFYIFSFPVQASNAFYFDSWFVRTLFEAGVIVLGFLQCFVVKRIKQANVEFR